MKLPLLLTQKRSKNSLNALLLSKPFFYRFPNSLTQIHLIVFLGAFFSLFLACNSETPTNSNAVEGTQRTVNQSPSNAPNGRPKLYDFNIEEMTIQSVNSKTVQSCLPISTEDPAPNFNIRITKPPLNGSIIPSISGSELCFNYTPNPNFSGKDPFEFSICNTSGFCLDKIWFADVKANTTTRPKSTISTSPVSSDVKISQPESASKSSIFDQSKKNRDDYKPNNND